MNLWKLRNISVFVAFGAAMLTSEAPPGPTAAHAEGGIGGAVGGVAGAASDAAGSVGGAVGGAVGGVGGATGGAVGGASGAVGGATGGSGAGSSSGGLGGGRGGTAPGLGSSAGWSFNFAANAESGLAQAAAFIMEVNGSTAVEPQARDGLQSVVGQLGGYRNALAAGDLHSAAAFLASAASDAVTPTVVRGVNSRLGIRLRSEWESEITTLARDQQ